MIQLTKKLCRIPKNLLILFKVRSMFINYNLCINISHKSVIFNMKLIILRLNSIYTVIKYFSVTQGHQQASSHNQQFRKYTNSTLYCFEFYINTDSPRFNKLFGYTICIIKKIIDNNRSCYLEIINYTSDKYAYTAKPHFIKQINTVIKSPLNDVTYIYKFLCNIVELYMKCVRIIYCAIFTYENITYRKGAILIVSNLFLKNISHNKCYFN